MKRIIAIIIIALIIRLFIAWQPVETLIQKTMPDDTFYGYSIARNIALGNGITYNGFDKTNGFQPLWIFLIAPVFLLTKDLYLAVNLILTVSAILDSLVVLLIYLLARKLFNEKVGLLSALFWAVNPLIIFQTMNGIEVTLYIFFVLLTFIYFYRIRDNFSIKNIMLLGILSGITFLARGDGIFLFIVLAAYLLWNRKIKLLLVFSLVSLLIVSPWLIWSQMTFGTIQESSQALKVYLSHGFFRPEGSISTFSEIFQSIKEDSIRSVGSVLQMLGIKNFGISIATIFMSVFFIICMILSLTDLRKLTLPIAFSIILIAFYVFYMWGIQIRYLTPIMPFIIILIFNGYSEIRFKYVIIFVMLVVIINGGIQWIDGYYPQQIETFNDVMWTNANVNGTIGNFYSGIPLYFSNNKVVNLEGILDFNALKAMKDKSVYSYMIEKNVTIWMDSTYHCVKNCGSACYGNCTPPFYAKDNATLVRWQKGGIDVIKENDYIAVFESDAKFKLIRNRCETYENLRGYSMMGCFFIAKVIR
jgi:hypothetical protein